MLERFEWVYGKKAIFSPEHIRCVCLFGNVEAKDCIGYWRLGLKITWLRGFVCYMACMLGAAVCVTAGDEMTNEWEEPEDWGGGERTFVRYVTAIPYLVQEIGWGKNARISWLEWDRPFCLARELGEETKLSLFNRDKQTERETRDSLVLSIVRRGKYTANAGHLPR